MTNHSSILVCKDSIITAPSYLHQKKERKKGGKKKKEKKKKERKRGRKGRKEEEKRREKKIRLSAVNNGPKLSLPNPWNL